ncbi:MAG: hypothetical protein JW873_03075 [Candidatus Saganbacteria bacterium]|nr:hypothetical protein [Candidatus Saganbacteria bacterium]
MSTPKKLEIGPGPTDRLTIGDTTYKTSGNILFDGVSEQYYVAESQLLDKMDKAIQVGIIENGMQSLLKRIKKS